jgi:hypothetical protein
MSITDKLVLAILVVVCVGVLMFLPPKSKAPCAVAEFSPDVTQEMKDECRSGL